MPQFIAPDAEHPQAAFLALGLLFIVNSLPITCAYAWLAGGAARRAGAVQRFVQRLDRIAGLMFIGFGAKLALSELPASRPPSPLRSIHVHHAPTSKSCSASSSTARSSTTRCCT